MTAVEKELLALRLLREAALEQHGECGLVRVEVRATDGRLLAVSDCDLKTNCLVAPSGA